MFPIRCWYGFLQVFSVLSLFIKFDVKLVIQGGNNCLCFLGTQNSNISSRYISSLNFYVGVAYGFERIFVKIFLYGFKISVTKTSEILHRWFGLIYCTFHEYMVR